MSMLKAALNHVRSGGSGNNISLGFSVAAKGANSSVKTVTTSGGSTTASGSDFFVVAAWYNSTTAPVITDSKGNTYTQVGTNVYNTTDQTGMAVFRCLNGTGGSGHTFTMTSGAGTYCSICALEVKGSNHTIDQSHQGTAISGTGPYVSGNITTTNANDVLIGFAYVDSESSSQSLSSNSPLTLKIQEAYASTTNIGCAISTQIVTSTQTVQASWSGASNGTYGGALIVALESS